LGEITLAAHAEGHVLKDMKDMAMLYKTRVRFNNYNSHTENFFSNTAKKNTKLHTKMESNVRR